MVKKCCGPFSGRLERAFYLQHTLKSGPLNEEISFFNDRNGVMLLFRSKVNLRRKWV